MKPLPKQLEKRARQIVKVWNAPNGVHIWTKLLDGLSKHQQSLVILRAEYLKDQS